MIRICQNFERLKKFLKYLEILNTITFEIFKEKISNLSKLFRLIRIKKCLIDYYYYFAYKLSADVPKMKNKYKSHMTINMSPKTNKGLFSEVKVQNNISVY